MTNQDAVKQMYDAVNIIANSVKPSIAYVLVTETKENKDDVISIFTNGSKTVGVGLIYRALQLFKDFVSNKTVGVKHEKTSKKEDEEKSIPEVQNP